MRLPLIVATVLLIRVVGIGIVVTAWQQVSIVMSLQEIVVLTTHHSIRLLRGVAVADTPGVDRNRLDCAHPDSRNRSLVADERSHHRTGLLAGDLT